jgi:hypothetical protein
MQVNNLRKTTAAYTGLQLSPDAVVFYKQEIICWCVTVADVTKQKTHRKRGTTSVELDGQSHDQINDYCERRGLKKKFVLSRLVSWFAVQPDSVKSAICDWVDAGMESAYAAALQELASAVKERAARRDRGADQVSLTREADEPEGPPTHQKSPGVAESQTPPMKCGAGHPS